MKLFTYKMTHDTGFAPNPFGHTLTLATCKPAIREKKKVGEWIAGFTSSTLNHDPVGEERLVFLMRIGEKCHLRDYFSDPRFRDKIPLPHLNDPILKAGDNIYRPLVPGATEFFHFEQLKNINHWAGCGPDLDHLREDVSGQFVLIADIFYYFGASPLTIPSSCRPKIPKGQARHGYRTQPDRAERFLNYIQSNYKPGLHCNPKDLQRDGLKDAGCKLPTPRPC
ncbi:hypothetical protein N8H71_19905 [Pseudomonas koreensis]|uniref:Nmad2 family putative nucleotide modification protein n=1 Tax=Pseudomonas koreensis TaxID=198620 RepID=UPI0021C80D13|nr:hypothetical protein [Pseudomonas koreensis]MCU0073863.1 hypothetical protein [Pseudomonas koreensis]